MRRAVLAVVVALAFMTTPVVASADTLELGGCTDEAPAASSLTLMPRPETGLLKPGTKSFAEGVKSHRLNQGAEIAVIGVGLAVALAVGARAESG